VNLPYPLPELDLSVPFDRYRARVVAEWVDPNKHMNMAYYMVAFDKATDVLLEQLGLSYAYTRHELGMIFVLEAHVTYERELCENDPIGVATRIVDRNRKLMHVFHRMVHADEGFAAATCELLLLHVDFRSRKSAPWPEVCTERIDAMFAAHRAMPDVDRAEHRLGIRPSRLAAA
jgi:acyl-CoA thioester hydrolase